MDIRAVVEVTKRRRHRVGWRETVEGGRVMAHTTGQGARHQPTGQANRAPGGSRRGGNWLDPESIVDHPIQLEKP